MVATFPSVLPSLPSFPNPIYLGSPIGLPIPTYLHLFFYPILGSLTSYILVDISMKPKMWLPKPPDSKAVPRSPSASVARRALLLGR